MKVLLKNYSSMITQIDRLVFSGRLQNNAHADSCRNVKNHEPTIASGVKEVVLYRSILTLAIDFLREKEKNASLWSHRFTLSLS